MDFDDLLNDTFLYCFDDKYYLNCCNYDYKIEMDDIQYFDLDIYNVVTIYMSSNDEDLFDFVSIDQNM